MFLTRFQLNPARSGARRLLASPQRMHAAVLSAFPGSVADETGRVLWRIDTVGRHLFLLIVSPERPDLTHLVEQAGWPTLENAWQTRNYDTLLGTIERGQTWAFRLTANPVHALAPKDGEKRGSIVAYRTPEQQLAWLEKHGAKHGFSLVEREVEGLDKVSGAPIEGLAPTAKVTRSEVVKFKRETSQVTLRIASFDGLLEVADPAEFRAALTHGIGPARAYGCGLLTIAPVG